MLSISFIACNDDDNEGKEKETNTEQNDEPLTTVSLDGIIVDGQFFSVSPGSLGNNTVPSGFRRVSLTSDMLRLPIVEIGFSNLFSSRELLSKLDKYLYEKSKYNFINKINDDELVKVTSFLYTERFVDKPYNEYDLVDDASNELRLTDCSSDACIFMFKVKVKDKASDKIRTIEGYFRSRYVAK